jgi:hypothetical protein
METLKFLSKLLARALLLKLGAWAEKLVDFNVTILDQKLSWKTKYLEVTKDWATMSCFSHRCS